MLLLLNLFSALALASRLAVILLPISDGLGVANGSQIPDDIYYGIYGLRDRYLLYGPSTTSTSRAEVNC